MNPNHLILPLLAATLFAYAHATQAAPPPPGPPPGMERGSHHPGGGPKKPGGHQFSPKWAETLTDKQKVAVDKMHLDVDRKEKLLRAKMRTADMELRELSIQDNADMKAINKKIDEIVGYRAEIMRNRYAHIVEMREILTEQQRISYDMGVLNHKGDKKH